MSDRAFFDTNILVYMIGQSDTRSAKAEELLMRGGYVSVQVLNELASVGRRKLGIGWEDVETALKAIREFCQPPLALRVQTHENALQLGARYGYSVYDSLILASALEARCTTLYSEDLQDGQVIERRLAILNPFAN